MNGKLKLIEENVRWYIYNISTRKNFLHKSVTAQTLKPKKKKHLITSE